MNMDISGFGTPPRKCFLVLLFLLLPFLAHAGELRSFTLDTGVFPCDSTTQEVTWVNSGPPAKIRSLTVFLGGDIGTVADIAACGITEKGVRLFCAVWERYQQPTGYVPFEKVFSPDYVLVGTGEWIKMQARCDGFNGKERHSQAVVTVWYTVR